MTPANLPAHRLVESGAWGAVGYAERQNGTMEAK